MAATVLDIRLGYRAAHHARRSKRVPAPVAPGLARGLPSRIHFWRGASGRRHLYSVYSLLECPALPQAIYLLVRREADGRRAILAHGTLEQRHAPANLATVRHSGALAGANEVHVCFTGAQPRDREGAAADIAAAIDNGSQPEHGEATPAHTAEYCSR